MNDNTKTAQSEAQPGSDEAVIRQKMTAGLTRMQAIAAIQQQRDYKPQGLALKRVKAK